MKLAEKLLSMYEGKIPQEEIKRGRVRTDAEQKGTRSDVGRARGLKTDTLVGWFSNAHNKTDGWMLHELSPSEKSEFGSDNVFRTYTDGTGTTSIVKIDIKKGTYAFIDNKYYEETDKVKFEKMSPYKNLLIEKTELGFKAFNII
jgi:hypothetical protein